MKSGNYFGTEIDDKWWKRYRGPSFFARGNGEFWMDEDGIQFRRQLTKTPLLIHWGEITDASLGKWHAGRWGGGRPILRINFHRGDQVLCAGFSLSKGWDEMETLASDLRKRTQRYSSKKSSKSSKAAEKLASRIASTQGPAFSGSALMIRATCSSVSSINEVSSSADAPESIISCSSPAYSKQVVAEVPPPHEAAASVTTKATFLRRFICCLRNAGVPT